MNLQNNFIQRARAGRRLLAVLIAALFCMGLVFPGTAADEPLDVSLSLSASPNPAKPGQAVSLNIKASAAGSTSVPTGTVVVQSDQGQSCTITLDTNGNGSCIMNFADPGRVLLQAIYPGSTPFLPAVSSKVLLPVSYLGDQTLLLENFETTPRPGWSDPIVSTAPNGEIFLGQFGNQTVTLNLSNLPPHNWVQIFFDLYVIGSWDGNLEIYEQPEGMTYSQIPLNHRGPDHWRFNIDGATTVDTTFSNWYYFLQAYPGSFGMHAYPPQTGALDINHLGYEFVEIPKDATYRMEFPLVHNATSLTLAFSGANLQSLEDESWGIDNLIILLSSDPVYPLYLPLISH